MQSELYKINVTLSDDQKQKILNAFINSAKIRLRLTKDNIRGPDTLFVPTRFFEYMDNEDGIDAVVDEQTEKEMWEEFKSCGDEMLKYGIPEDEIGQKFWKKFKSYRDEPTNDKMWEYYGLFFVPAIDEDLENKGIEFNLDYSLVNDLTKDFVKNNIKKLVL